MHICLVGIEYPIDTNFGGISTYQFLLAKSLAKLNNKVTVICGTDKDDYDYYENDIHIIRLHTRIHQPHQIQIHSRCDWCNIYINIFINYFSNNYSVLMV